MKCPFCGSNLESNAKYCNDCGTAVDSPDSHKAHNYYRGNPPYTPSSPRRTPPVVQRRNVTNTQEPQYRQPTITPQSISNAPYNRKPVKKNSGCAIIILIIVLLFFAIGIISSIFGDEFFNKIENSISEFAENGEITIFDSDSDSFDIIDDYYENEDANLSFLIPDGFRNSGDGYDERELIGTYRNELEVVNDEKQIFIQIIVTDEYSGSVRSIQKYTDNRITAIYTNHPDGDAECDSAFSIESVPFRDGKEYSATINYSVGGEKHVSTIVGFDIGEKVCLVYIDSPSAETNMTILNGFDIY
jgi:hypothetical protein